MNGMDRLLARQREALRLSLMFQAEYRGLIHAQFFPTPVRYSENPDEEAAFLRGFREGRAILVVYGASERRRA